MLPSGPSSPPVRYVGPVGCNLAINAGTPVSKPVIGTSNAVPPNQFQPVCHPIAPTMDFDLSASAHANIEKTNVNIVLRIGAPRVKCKRVKATDVAIMPRMTLDRLATVDKSQPRKINSSILACTTKHNSKAKIHPSEPISENAGAKLTSRYPPNAPIRATTAPIIAIPSIAPLANRGMI